MKLTEQQEKEVQEPLFAGRKIEAIKRFREATGCGLKEAKEAVEALEVKLRKENPHPFEKAAAKGGCFGMLLLFVVLAMITAVGIL